jgi:hypothetical protein
MCVSQRCATLGSYRINANYYGPNGRPVFGSPSQGISGLGFDSLASLGLLGQSNPQLAEYLSISQMTNSNFNGSFHFASLFCLPRFSNAAMLYLRWSKTSDEYGTAGI